MIFQLSEKKRDEKRDLRTFIRGYFEKSPLTFGGRGNDQKRQVMGGCTFA